jgi:hypothetical protein
VIIQNLGHHLWPPHTDCNLGKADQRPHRRAWLTVRWLGPQDLPDQIVQAVQPLTQVWLWQR